MMARPIVLPPEPSVMVERKAWALIRYFNSEFPRAFIKIEVRHPGGKQFCIINNAGDTSRE